MRYLKKNTHRIKTALKKGLTPHQLALSISLAVMLTLFPVYGITILIFTLITVPLRLNLSIMIAVNFLIEPLRFILFIPLMKIGLEIMGETVVPFTFETLQRSFDTSFWKTLESFSKAFLHAFIGWVSVVIPMACVLYFSLRVIFTQAKKKKASLGY